jgi:hypothetical protein
MGRPMHNQDLVAVEIRPEAIVPPMSDAALARVRELEEQLFRLPQIAVRMHHVLHGGMYARTAYVPKGAVMGCCLVRVPTIIVLAGAANIYIGQDEPLHLEGYCVVPASAGRKQVYLALSDFALTMFYATTARTVEEAENETTAEATMLASRRADLNTVIITGE